MHVCVQQKIPARADIRLVLTWSVSLSFSFTSPRIKMSITKDRKSNDRRTIDVDEQDWSWFINGPPPPPCPPRRPLYSPTVYALPLGDFYLQGKGAHNDHIFFSLIITNRYFFSFCFFFFTMQGIRIPRVCTCLYKKLIRIFDSSI